MLVPVSVGGGDCVVSVMFCTPVIVTFGVVKDVAVFVTDSEVVVVSIAAVVSGPQLVENHTI